MLELQNFCVTFLIIFYLFLWDTSACLICTLIICHQSCELILENLLRTSLEARSNNHLSVEIELESFKREDTKSLWQCRTCSCSWPSACSRSRPKSRSKSSWWSSSRGLSRGRIPQSGKIYGTAVKALHLQPEYGFPDLPPPPKKVKKFQEPIDWNNDLPLALSWRVATNIPLVIEHFVNGW